MLRFRNIVPGLPGTFVRFGARALVALPIFTSAGGNCLKTLILRLHLAEVAVRCLAQRFFESDPGGEVIRESRCSFVHVWVS